MRMGKGKGKWKRKKENNQREEKWNGEEIGDVGNK